MPGSHDVNRGARHGYFLLQEAAQQTPVPPYFPKWTAYATAFRDFYHDIPGVTFTPDEPWSLYEMKDLGVVVAGLNSTMPETHEHSPADRPAEISGVQLDWFARRLAILGRVGWRRIAAVSNHVTRDADGLDETLGVTGTISLLLSGNTDGPRKLPSGVHVMPIERLTSASMPEKYEIITVRPGDITRHGRVRTGTGWASLSLFIDNVHRVFAAADPGVNSELVYAGAAASPELIHKARRQGVRLRSFIDYQGLLDLRPYTERQARTLAADRLYPAALYVAQRFVVASGGPAQPLPEIRADLLDQATNWLSSDAARLVVVLGDFGRGKTSFLRQLTRRLPNELPYLTPVLVELRYLEKGPTLDDLLAQHLIRHGVEDFSQAKLKYMIEQGRVALLFDGFDELELRVGYDSAADYLQSLLNSLSGQAKVARRPSPYDKLRGRHFPYLVPGEPGDHRHPHLPGRRRLCRAAPRRLLQAARRSGRPVLVGHEAVPFRPRGA